MRIRGFQWNVNCNGLAPPLDIPASYFVFLWRDNLSLGTQPVQCFSWFDQLALFKAFVHQDGNSLSCQVFLGHEISSRSSMFDGRGAGFLYKKRDAKRRPFKDEEGDPNSSTLAYTWFYWTCQQSPRATPEWRQRYSGCWPGDIAQIRECRQPEYLSATFQKSERTSFGSPCR